jgi:hypothetical protein
MPLKGRKGKVNAIITSPPFPLVKKKKYGNETGDAYITWLKGLAPRRAVQRSLLNVIENIDLRPPRAAA